MIDAVGEDLLAIDLDDLLRELAAVYADVESKL